MVFESVDGAILVERSVAHCFRHGGNTHIPIVKDYQSHVEVKFNLLESLYSLVLYNRLQKSPVVDVNQSA